MKKNLEKDSATANNVTVQEKITDKLLRELAADAGLSMNFAGAKTPAARADLLFKLTNKQWKEAKAEFDKIDDFLTKLERWFVQELSGDQRGVTGKLARVEIKKKDIAKADDWAKVYAYIKKTGSFDLLNKAVNQKAVAERWSDKKKIPGMGKYTAEVVSLDNSEGEVRWRKLSPCW